MVGTAIYGAGGFGRETKILLDQLALSGTSVFAGFIDDHQFLEPAVTASEVQDVVIAIADPQIRKNLVASMSQYNFKYKSLIHPDVFLDSSNTLGKGCIICSGVKITCNVCIEDFCIINLNTVIGHDVRLERFCSVMPSANILGGVKIGEGTFIGAGATILQGLKIGECVVIGAGSVVTKDIPAGHKVMGVPARVR